MEYKGHEKKRMSGGGCDTQSADCNEQTAKVAAQRTSKSQKVASVSELSIMSKKGKGA